MSLRWWNSVAERARLERYILISEMLLEEESVYDSSSCDSSMDGMEDTLDQDLSFLTDVEDDEDEEDEEASDSSGATEAKAEASDDDDEDEDE